MATDLKNVLADKKDVKVDINTKAPQDPALDPKDPGSKQVDKEIEKKAEHLKNLNKAIEEGNAELTRIRKAKGEKEPDEVLPQIDFQDPGSKAWDKRIKDTVDPVQKDVDKGKLEVRTFALRTFLKDKPALAANSDKIKELMGVYEKIKDATETTVEGVLLDLSRAFGALFSDELIERAKSNRVAKTEADILFSDAAVSSGSTSISQEKEVDEPLSEGDRAILQRWGYTPEEYRADKKKQAGK